MYVSLIFHCSLFHFDLASSVSLRELNLGWHALCPSLLAKTFWPGYDVQLRRADSWPQPLLQPSNNGKSPTKQPTNRNIWSFDRIMIHHWSIMIQSHSMSEKTQCLARQERCRTQGSLETSQSHFLKRCWALASTQQLASSHGSDRLQNTKKEKKLTCFFKSLFLFLRIRFLHLFSTFL